MRGLVALAVLTAGVWVPANATAEETPSLVAYNAFAATGSAQATFRLEHDAVLRLHGGDLLNQIGSDAEIRTSGDWAALVIQRVAPERTVMTGFIGLPGQCGWVDWSLCETKEVDFDIGSETGPQTPPGFYPSDIWMRAGTYVIAILAEPGAETTAKLELSDPEEPTTWPEIAVSKWNRRANAALAEPHLLSEPTRGALSGAVSKELASSGWEGSLDSELPDLGIAIGGFNATWDHDSYLLDPSPLRLRDCITRPIAGDTCGGWDFRERATFASRAGIGQWVYGGLQTLPGDARFRWDWDGTTKFFRGSAWLLTWPFVS